MVPCGATGKADAIAPHTGARIEIAAGTLVTSSSINRTPHGCAD